MEQTYKKSNKTKKYIICIIIILIIILTIICFKIVSGMVNTEPDKTNSNNKNLEVKLPSTSETTPYLPTGFSYLENTNLTTGLVIQDSLGNQYVWVEVPRNLEVYPTVGLNITSFTDDECAGIENDLHTYTATYREGTTYTDTWYSKEQHGFASENDYNTLKYKMLTSVYQNGGFYIGKYETGTDTVRIDEKSPLTTAVIQQNAYPYHEVTCSQAQMLADGMESGEYTTSLMFGVQWDLVLKHLETKGTTKYELNSDSTRWGNYTNNLWTITNSNSKYAEIVDIFWDEGAYGSKTQKNDILLSTGASDIFSKQGIYDLTGNVYEWTLEGTSDGLFSSYCVLRGGSYQSYGGRVPASYRLPIPRGGAIDDNGFRVSLY